MAVINPSDDTKEEEGHFGLETSHTTSMRYKNRPNHKFKYMYTT